MFPEEIIYYKNRQRGYFTTSRREFDRYKMYLEEIGLGNPDNVYAY